MTTEWITLFGHDVDTGEAMVPMTVKRDNVRRTIEACREAGLKVTSQRKAK